MYKKNKLASAIASVMLVVVGVQEVSAQSSGGKGPMLEE